MANQKLQSNCCIQSFISPASRISYKVLKITNFSLNDIEIVEGINDEITGVSFKNCNHQNILFKLDKVFPNIKILKIQKSSLSLYHRSDLENLKNLKEIHIIGCRNLYKLSNDLFKGLQEMTCIIFNNNGLVVIEPNIFDNLPNLKYVNLNSNLEFTGFYDEYKMNGNFKTFKELNSELIIKYQKFQNFTLQKMIEEERSQTQGSEIEEIE